MEILKGIPMFCLVKLICKRCLPNVCGVASKQLAIADLALCDSCVQKCIDFKKIKESV